jgi:glycosyltransferase involved in cell wall biosynthesis
MGKKLHICLLTSGRVFDIIYGGEGKFSRSLGNWLMSQGHDVLLMGSGFATVKASYLSRLSTGENNGKNIKPKKIRELYPPYPIYALSRLVLSLQWVLKIISTHARWRIMLIHAQDTGYSGLAAVISGKILRIPVIISSHGIRHKSLEVSLKGKFRRILVRLEYRLDIFTIKNANHIMVDSPAIKAYYEQIMPESIEVMPIPIKLKNYEFSDVNRIAIRKELGIDMAMKIVGFVGRFEAEKNLLNLLIAFSDLAKQDPSLRLALVGTGSQEPQLREYVRRRGVGDRVIFCGVRSDIGKILSALDIFVLPSYIEGLSTALLEAMTCGRAVICSNIPANTQVVAHDREALLVDPSNREELKEAICRLVQDDSLRLKLGSNARIRATQYDEDIVFPKIIRSYDALTRLKRR